MKKLLVLANEFPYGTWEPYMETEEKYYSKFDQTWIASLQLRDDHAKTRRPLQCGATVIPVRYASRLFYLLNSFTVLLDKNLYKEIVLLKNEKRLNISRLIDLFVFLSRARHEARVIDRKLKNEDKNNMVIYSYRFEYQPYVAILLKNKWGRGSYILSRAHRYDIYEDQHKNDYIPLREIILNNIDCVLPCSQHGVEYIREHYRNISALVECNYLGTVDYGKGNIPVSMSPLKIVSCSNVVKVKRIDKIVSALSMIDDIEIEWTHYGDGPLLEEVKKGTSKKLGKNVHAHFMGNIPNSELLRTYSLKDFHIFLNVSSSEGLPVSIMEAMSFGIPCIATNVGGTKELVDERNGILMDDDANAQEIANALRCIAEMNIEDYITMRENARASWNKDFNSEKNYSEFVRKKLNRD